MRTARGFSPTTRPDADPGGQAPLSEEFVARVAAAQRPLFAYIRSLVGPWAEPEDILQEVNLVLCRKAREFDHGPYLTWACRVAYLQFLAHLKRHRRERHRFLDELLLAEMADTLAERVEQLDDRLDALRRCVAKLSPAHRRMVTAVNNSLLMADGWEPGEFHWQIGQDDTIILGVQTDPKGRGSHYHAVGAVTPERFGQWMHLATVYERERGLVRHYLDGQLVSEEPIQFDVPLRVGEAEVGNWNAAAHRNKTLVRYLNGCMDELMLFTRALSGDEVARLYSQGRPPS